MEDHCSSESNWPQINDTLLYPKCQIGPHSSANFQTVPSCWSFPAQVLAEHKTASASASTSHSQAEKRRRDRINTQLGILRKFVPNSDKMDKAALLGSAIEQVKELKEKAKEVSKGMIVPTEVDEVIVDHIDQLVHTSDNNINNNILIRVSMCCDDRPEVLSELMRAVKGLKLSIVGADFASVGGRLKSILILCKDLDRFDLSLSAVKQSFNLVLSRISSSSLPSTFRVRSKRQRFFLSSD